MVVSGTLAVNIVQSLGCEVIRRGKTGVRQQALALYLQEDFRLIDACQNV
jgi:hypothetical protein